MITLFDDLPDLSLIEIFSYLSCVDALWSFTNLNTHLTILLTERGFYRHVNLSSTSHIRFQMLLPLLRFNEIESLVIDSYASSLQLRTWPYLPYLVKLTVKGVRDFVDLFKFAKQHANTLTHFCIESSDYSNTAGITKAVCYPSWNLCEFIRKILHYLTGLRSLDFGMNQTFFLHNWPFKTIETPLTNLTITLASMRDLLRIMSTKPLAHTLRQLHIAINDMCIDIDRNLDGIILLSPMKVLETLSIIKSFHWCSSEEWTFINALTSSSVMPILRQIRFCIVIDTNNFVRMNHSLLFTDFRHVDVRYALIINDDRSHMELRQYVQHFNQSRYRQIASATFISECWPDNQLFKTPNQYYREKAENRQHLFYTLPWSFKEFFRLCVPERCINRVDVPAFSSQMNKIYSTHLIKLTMSDNLPSSTMFFSFIVCPNQISELHLFQCDRRIFVNLPNLIHLVLIDSLDSLNSSFSKNVRSIQIILHHRCLRFTIVDWSVLTRLSSLPMLNSLRILLYGMDTPPNDTICQIIAKTVSIVSDFSLCFRRGYFRGGYNIDLAYMKHSLFIDQLRNCILALPLIEKPQILVEKDGCGIIVWF